MIDKSSSMWMGLASDALRLFVPEAKIRSVIKLAHTGRRIKIIVDLSAPSDYAWAGMILEESGNGWNPVEVYVKKITGETKRR